MSEWELWILACYLTLVILVAFRMRRVGVNLFDFFVFAVNAGAIAWLIFLYMWLDEHSELDTLPHSWIFGGCLLIAGLLVPAMIRGIVLAALPKQDNLTAEERAEALQIVRRRYPRALVTFTIGLAWMVFLGGKRFGYFLSHSWVILLGIAASAVVGWIIVALINHRRLSDKGAAS
jgi:hypothetical protein